MVLILLRYYKVIYQNFKKTISVQIFHLLCSHLVLLWAMYYSTWSRCLLADAMVYALEVLQGIESQNIVYKPNFVSQLAQMV